MKRKIKLGWILTLGSIITSIIVPISLSTSFYGVDQTIISFRFPNSFIKNNFNSSRPWIEFTFFIKNYNRGELDLDFKLMVEVVYYQKPTGQILRDEIFKINSVYRCISYGESLSALINASYIHFNLINLQNFWDNVNLTKSYSFLMTAELKGSYLFDLISFEIAFYGMNMSQYIL